MSLPVRLEQLLLLRIEQGKTLYCLPFLLSLKCHPRKSIFCRTAFGQSYRSYTDMAMSCWQLLAITLERLLLPRARPVSHSMRLYDCGIQLHGRRLRLLKHTSLVWFSLLSAMMISISYQYLATDALASSNELPMALAIHSSNSLQRPMIESSGLSDSALSSRLLSYVLLAYRTCVWSYQDAFLVTGSRDKMIKTWRIKDGQLHLASSFKLSAAVTALDSTYRHNQHLLAAGLESGSVELLQLADGGDVSSLCSLPATLASASSLSQVAFRPQAPDGDSDADLQLATASTDHHVKVIGLKVFASAVV
eukprot:m.12095 g.12095  ORF g.12095 m.12095 type:complete len:307 (+) comp9905_c0_seq1:1520-2440(+)